MAFADKTLPQLPVSNPPDDGAGLWLNDQTQTPTDRRWTLGALVSWIKPKLFPISIAEGGTSATDIETARMNLSVPAINDIATVGYSGNHGDLVLDDGTNPHGTTKADVGLGSVSDDPQLKIANNLDDLDDASVARTNLDVYSTGEIDLVTSGLSSGKADRAGDTFTGPVIFDDTVTVNADIIQNGAAYETHAEQVFTTKDKIITRNGAISGLAPGDTTGFVAKLYDGVNDGELSFNSDGIARVGDVGSTQALATREDSPVDGGLASWDAATNKFVTDQKGLENIEVLEDFRAWDATRTYAINQPAFENGIPYRSLVSDNLNFSPSANPDKWELVGGGGSGSKNFVLNPLTQNNITDWTVTGATGTWESDIDLVVDGGFKVTTFATGDTIDGNLDSVNPVDGGQAWEIKLGYYIDAGATYTDGQIQIVLLDGANEISGGNLPIVLGTVSQTSVFVWPSTTLTGLKVRIKCSGGTGNLRIADVAVRPQQIMSVPAVSGWIELPLSIVDQNQANVMSASPVTSRFIYRRVGSNLQGIFSYYHTTTPGISGTGAYYIKLPLGLSSALVGSLGGAGNSSTSIGSMNGDTGGSNRTIFSLSAGQSWGIGSANPTTFTSGSTFRMDQNFVAIAGSFSVPISQWSTNIQVSGEETIYLSNSESTVNTNGVVAKTYYGIEGSPILANTTGPTYYDMTLPRALLPNEKVELELRSKIDGNWIPTVLASVPSLSVVSFSGGYTFGTAGQYLRTMQISKVSTNVLRVFIPTSVIGMTLANYPENTPIDSKPWSVILSASDGFDRWRVRISRGGSMAEVPPVVRAEYVNIASTGANLPINYQTKVEDTHNAVTTGAGWKFTAPFPGVYVFTVGLVSTGSNWIDLYLNGVYSRHLDFGATGGGLFISSSIRLGKNDYMDIRSASGANSATDISYRIQITRIGA